MSNGLFVAGTDTEVGKTFITCQLLRQYRLDGVNAVGMKPVASGMQQVDGQWVNEDVEQIYQASGGIIGRELINQYAFSPFIAPHQAAQESGKSISLQKIEDGYTQLVERAERVIVEGAGGLMTPLNDKETFVDLVQRLQLDVILVVAIRLGCINHALLTQQVMQAGKIRFTGWVANYPEAAQSRDQAIEESLEKRLDAPLLGVMSWDPSREFVRNLDLCQIT
ncbi:MAG: dethiobiotin synthase [Gammaproteobacteria bacterium]|nr:dethiobiotin synthase [Gammaproteobacteria bacterium]